jgi:hypothetical protein
MSLVVNCNWPRSLDSPGDLFGHVLKGAPLSFRAFVQLPYELVARCLDAGVFLDFRARRPPPRDLHFPPSVRPFSRESRGGWLPLPRYGTCLIDPPAPIVHSGVKRPTNKPGAGRCPLPHRVLAAVPAFCSVLEFSEIRDALDTPH